jgi:hypothetical protein
LPRIKKKKKVKIHRFIDKRIPFEELPFKTIKLTVHALKWIFLLIFLFITIGIFILFITGGDNYMQLILGYSIAGFFTFFMGYFGWTLAISIMELISGKSYKNEERGLTYYIGRRNKYKF